MKLLIVAGGGGHFAPAMAVISILPKDTEVLVVGRKHTFEGDTSLSLEYQTTQALGIPFAPLESGRLQRKFTKHTLSSLSKVPKGLNNAYQILKGFRPDVVASFGGYISLPIVMAASFMRIPVVLHEQTFGAGLANKVAAKFATKICLSWHESEKYFPKRKIVMTGNPVKKEILDMLQNSPEEARETLFKTFDLPKSDLPLLYITGGSGGSHAINATVQSALGELLHAYVLVHQTGDSTLYKDFDALTKAVAELPEALQSCFVLRKFLSTDEVALSMRAADVTVGRAGVGTVTELAVLGRKALLIPLASGQKYEQMTNALFLKEIGLGEILEQAVLTPETLLAEIGKVLHNKSGGESEKLLRARITEAPQAILDVIHHVYKQTTAKKTSKRE